LIIRRAALDLCMPVEIVGVQTAREPDGLAMSSRNRYLSAEERAIAPAIYAELERARQAIESGSSDFAELTRRGTQALRQAGFRPDYFEIRDAATLEEPSAQSRELVVLTAARIGRARLIDNVRATRAL
jgi:pantoate--beta-alanine ligase